MVRIPIEIGKTTWEIRSEERQWTVGRVRTIDKGKEAGQEAYDVSGHYGSLLGAINGAFELKLRQSDATTLQELQMEVRKAQDELKGLYEASVK